MIIACWLASAGGQAELGRGAAPSVSFMKAPPGNDLKAYDGAWHVRINDQWRLTFKWGKSGPYDVRIEDPH
jgi:toxin HigB-1